MRNTAFSRAFSSSVEKPFGFAGAPGVHAGRPMYFPLAGQH
jgi:hypothetical protein